MESRSPEETYSLGLRMGQEASAGEIYALDGDLGAGKTVFCKGFAQGLGISDTVSSPTFTILQIYEEGRLPLYHFDVYRIADPEEMEEVGLYEYLEGDGVCLIEWGQRIEELLPAQTRHIYITAEPEKGPEFRNIVVE